MQRISITNPQNIIDGTAKKYYFKLRNTGGPKGDKGDKGDTGATGPQGPQGNAATVSVGSTTTLPVGYDATVTNSGSFYNAVLDFGIPQGPQGPQGAKGDKGDTGAKGDTGPRGPQGERGTNATVYVGTTTTTNPGTQARVYNSGTDSNAVLNFEIPRGDVGPQPELVQTTGTSTTKAMSQKATTDALNTKQAIISSSNKLSADLVTDTTTTNKFVTAEDKTTWNAKQNALTAGQGIDITSDVISTPAIVPEVVASLPAEGTEGKLYLTPKAHTTSTATGNPITASVTEQAGTIESFQLDGDTFQQSYTGKNLFNKESYNRATVYVGTSNTLIYWDRAVSVYIPCEPNTTYTFSKLNTGTNQRFCVFTTETTPAPDVSVIDVVGTKSGEDNSASYTITTSANAQFLGAFIAVSGSTTPSIADIAASIQIEKGSSATAFEPYVGGTSSPNPDYPQPIQTVTGEQTVTVFSKNLFSGQNLTEDSRVSTSNGGTYGREGYDVSDYIKIEPSKNYALTCGNAQNGSYFSWYDSTKTYISGSSWQNKTAKTSPANAAYIRFDFLASDVDIVQFEKGSASSYVPYSNVSYPLDLGNIELCKLGTYQDYIYKDGDSWKVHKANRKTVITDDNTRGSFQSSTNTSRLAFGGITPQGTPEGTNAELCDKLGRKYNWTTDSQGFYMNGSVIVARIAHSVVGNTEESFVSWLANNPLTIYYALATATDTVITDTALIAQLEAIRTASLENGTNTITNSTPAPNLAGDMEIGYYGYNPTNRYDKFIWLDLNNAYEQLNNPDTSSTLSTLSTRSLGTTAEQPTVTRSLETETITLKKGETETITLKKGEAEPIEDEAELPTILDDNTEETETAEPEESDGTDER